MEDQEVSNCAKWATGGSFDTEEFNCADDPILEDFYEESAHEKVSPTRVMKQEEVKVWFAA